MDVVTVRNVGVVPVGQMNVGNVTVRPMTVVHVRPMTVVRVPSVTEEHCCSHLTCVRACARKCMYACHSRRKMAEYLGVEMKR